MMDKQWIKQLRREASAHRMCAENRDALKAVESKSEAIALYKKTIDWALEEGYPCLNTLRREFSDCEADGIFIDKHFTGETLIDHQVYVFHNCTGTIKVGLNTSRRIIPMLYFANGCKMNVTSMDNAPRQVQVPLYIFGDNQISAPDTEDLICRTYKFSVN